MFAKIVKDFDFYRKIPKDLTETSTHSTILSVCASLFMLVLFIVELWAFLTYRVSTNIVIDPNTDSMLRINFNITVLDMPCDYATIDVVDVLGTRHDNVTLNINKWQVDENGIRRGYQGRNPEQQDIMHEANLDLAQLQANGIHAVPLDTRNFDLWLSHHEYTFVDFFAPWCHWCQRLQPVWEAFAERVETDHIPVSIVTVDCVDHPDLCLKYKIQAFPTMRMFKHGKPQSPDYHADRTVDAFVEFVNSRLALDEQLHMMSAEEREAHEKREEDSKSDHPGCMLSGFLLVNRVPGNFHIQMRSALHNINPAGANLSHVVNHLSFGPTLPRTALNAISIIPQDIFTIDSTQPMNDKMYTNLALHQAFHHYIKVNQIMEALLKFFIFLILFLFLRLFLLRLKLDVNILKPTLC